MQPAPSYFSSLICPNSALTFFRTAPSAPTASRAVRPIRSPDCRGRRPASSRSGRTTPLRVLVLRNVPRFTRLVTLKISQRACSRVLPRSLNSLRMLRSSAANPGRRPVLRPQVPSVPAAGLRKCLRRVGDHRAGRVRIREQIVEVPVVDRVGQAVRADHADDLARLVGRALARA